MIVRWIALLALLAGCARPLSAAPVVAADAAAVADADAEAAAAADAVADVDAAVAADAAPDAVSATETVARTPDAGAPITVVLHGGTVVSFGGADLDFAGADIAAVRTGAAIAQLPVGAQVADVSGQWLAPAFVDSHVHLVYLPKHLEMAHNGVAVGIDHAAPLGFFATGFAPMLVVGSGPMIAAPDGYPLNSWGKNGYGLPCADQAAAVAAVAMLADKGAGLIKVALESGPKLDQPTLAAVVQAAHGRKLPVSCHALGDAEAALAAQVGVDVLAHTPTGLLQPATVQAWSKRAVISTLAAFGGAAAVDNLNALRQAGTTVLYGTDFGNTVQPGIQPNELQLLGKAGLDGAAILAAGTTAPAKFWHLPRHGSLQPGKAASVLVLGQDPLVTPLVLAKPTAVWIEGKLQN